MVTHWQLIGMDFAAHVVIYYSVYNTITLQGSLETERGTAPPDIATNRRQTKWRLKSGGGRERRVKREIMYVMLYCKWILKAVISFPLRMTWGEMKEQRAQAWRWAVESNVKRGRVLRNTFMPGCSGCRVSVCCLSVRSPVKYGRLRKCVYPFCWSAQSKICPKHHFTQLGHLRYLSVLLTLLQRAHFIQRPVVSVHLSCLPPHPGKHPKC